MPLNGQLPGAGRLAGAGRIIEESAAQACVPLARQLHRALGELDAAIRAARTVIAPRQEADG